MSKQSLIIFLIIFVTLEFFNISILFLDKNFPTYAYNQLIVIKSFDFTSIFLDFAIIILLIVKIKLVNSKKNKLNLFSLLLFFIALFLIWGEIIYSSLYYYGGIGNHQGLPTDANNLGLFGSVVILQYFFILIISRWQLNKYKKVIFYFLFFTLNLYIHYQLFKLLTPL